jgi:predicted methyltransferase
MHLVLSHYQAQALLKAREHQQPSIFSSADLSLSVCEVMLSKEGCTFPSRETVSWENLTHIAEEPNACFRLEDGEPVAIRAFSEVTGRAFSLYPTAGAPTMLISGIPMHRIKDTEPWRDTASKLKAAGINGGKVLDTATGLGYTAIQAAAVAESVVTIELDPAAHEMCRQNPWSQPLFANEKITLRLGDSFEEIETFDPETFSIILHDPPAFQLAGELYSAEFYRRAFRVLKPHGRMFHYIGDPHSKSGARTTRGVVLRLQQAGFTRILPKPEAFGVLAYK